MKLVFNEQIPRGNWNKLIENNYFSSPFQSPEFYDFFNSITGFYADAIAVEESGFLLALVVITIQKEKGIKGFFSRRAIIYGGPIIENNSEEALEYLIRGLNSEFNHKVIYIETRNFSDYSSFTEVFNKNGWKYLPYGNFLIHSSNIDKAFQTLANNRKRQIKKAINSGVKIKEAENNAEIQEFYDILHDLYKKKIMKPLFPVQFFEEFFSRNLGKYFLVIFEGRIIGGIMCPILKGKCIYEFYICGLDKEYQEQYPSVMATWTAIEFANKNQIPVFNFMGAGEGSQSYGVRDFKARFGGEFVEQGRYIKINNHLMFLIGKAGIRFSSLFRK